MQASHDGQYKKDSLSLIGAVAMGTGVMIGAGVFALTGQIAEQAGGLFPYAFLASAVVTGFSAYSYVKMSNVYPSAGGIAMYLEMAYGKGVMTAGCALLMYFSMVINESLVARTFGTYTLQLFDVGKNSWLVPALGVGLIAFAYIVNISGNRFIGTFSMVMAAIKIVGIAAFAIIGLWVADFSPEGLTSTNDASGGGFVASIALGILAYKGFTTITNSGAEIKDPHRNVSRAIIISIVICVVLYFFMAWAVASALSLDKIIEAKDYALAEAARPAVGKYGVWFTVGLAIVATVSGVIASVFAVSRVLAMLTDMKLVPHSHFGMSGRIQKHTLVYTIVIAMAMTIFFDLSRIASLGAIFYIVMDIAIHWGVLRHLRKDVEASAIILVCAILFDVLVLGAFLWVKAGSDPMVIFVSLAGMAMIFGGEWLFLRQQNQAA
ncbi:MAG: amino acid permease [Phycisphaeraceae bacterium]|nr:amino acid permease [Phycisphaeraceae bacterium]